MEPSKSNRLAFLISLSLSKYNQWNMEKESSSSLEGMLLKLGLFILVQSLVYLILSQSSNVFSNNPTSSQTVDPARNFHTVRRWAAAVADIPVAGDSPSPPSSPSSSRRYWLINPYILWVKVWSIGILS